MKDLRQNGIAVMLLSDVVDDFCLAQGNMRQSGILAQYRHARWAWKEMFRKTLWEISKAVLCIDPKDHSIHLPENCERVINISVVDNCGKLHPLGFNTDFNTTHIRCQKPSCSCGTCNGEDTLCAAIDTIGVVTETVIINGQPYPKTTLTRYNGAGAVQTQEAIPAWDVATASVIFNTLVNTACNVEATTSGCIAATTANMGLLRDHCGCGNFFDQWSAVGGYSWNGAAAYRELIAAPYNYWGEFNFNSSDPRKVHIFSHATQHFNHSPSQEKEWRSGLRQVIVEFQTNGETPATEILVPEYAVEALEDGMVYRQKRLNNRASESEKIAARNAWNLALVGIVKYHNPINLELVAKLQTNKRLW